MSLPAHEILQLGYVRIGVTDMGWWRRFADLVGFHVDAADGELHLRTDNERIYRIALHEAEQGGVTAMGWEVRDAEAMQAVIGRLAQLGFAANATDAALRNARQVEEVAVVRSPDGLPNEIYWGPNSALRKRFSSPHGVQFEAGACGNGHVTLNTDDAPATLDFYLKGMGLRLSDAAWMEGHSRVYFLRCNARHHSYAFAQMPGRAPGTVHVMADIARLDMLGAVRDRLLDAGVALSRDLGSHPLDGVISLYVATPEGYEFELASGTRWIEESTWEADRYQRRDLPWGHRRPDPTKGRG